MPAVSLEEARDRAQAKRKEAKSCKGQVEPDSALVSLPERPRTPPDRVTFRQAFQVYFDQKEKQLGNAKHLDQWRSTMREEPVTLRAQPQRIVEWVVPTQADEFHLAEY